jgi:hypothetical protein
MLTHHIALVSEAKSIGTARVMKIAAALQKQATRDLAPIWKVSAAIGGFAQLEDVPLGYWPIIVMEDVRDAAGYHEDEDGQPYAVVEAGASWSLTASHECLEMLVDPFGRRLVAGPSPKVGQGRVQFLVEVCDPSEDEAFAYTINDVLVSDFYTPSYFDPLVSGGTRYSFTGAITRPREVLRGGYLSWRVPATKHWWQATWFGAKPKFADLGIFSGARSLREEVDSRRPEFRRLARLSARNPVLRAAQSRSAHTETQTRAWADSLRRQVRALA